MSVASIRTLRLLMPISAICSSIAQVVAILTNEWLYTTEFQPNADFQKFKMSPEMEYHRKHTSSGLWLLCYNEPPDVKMICSYIDYFSGEEYIADQNDSTMAIPYSVKQAAAYFFASCIILFLGEMIYLFRNACGHRQIYTFISGITFILAGLTILAGLVVYISTFKGEVSNKLRPLSEFQDALFHFRYGYSFLMLVISLVMCEITGTLSIFLYITQKRFQIMIEAEREEVLKKNILNLIAPDLRILAESHQSLHQPPTRRSMEHQNPTFRIILDDDENNSIPVGGGGGAGSPRGSHFLSPEFGLDSAFYMCGRHGTRGRRNSRTTETFLGPPEASRSRKNSFTSIPDETSHQHHSTMLSVEKSTKNQNKFIGDNKLDANYRNDPPPPPIHELHVPSLAKIQTLPTNQNYMLEENTGKLRTNRSIQSSYQGSSSSCSNLMEKDHEMPYLSMSNAHQRSGDISCRTLPANRSTLV